MDALAFCSDKVRYLRIPHWVRLEYRCFHPSSPVFGVRLEAREHRAKLKSLSVRGIFFAPNGAAKMSSQPSLS